MKHSLDARMRLQKLRHRKRIFHVLFHSKFQRLQAAIDHRAVEGRRNNTHGWKELQGDIIQNFQIHDFEKVLSAYHFVRIATFPRDHLGA